MSILEAVILGIIQGLTEFLPISSSGHIELGSHILGVESSDNLLFSTFVHAATALSTIIVFRADILNLVKDILKFQWNESTAFAAKIIVSMVPVAVIGLLFEEEIESFFGGKIVFVAAMLIVTSILLSVTYFSKKNEGDVSFVKAFIIGVAQAMAILPGISRSGATIATALTLGVDKEKATRFSFLMVLIPILGASLLKTKDIIESPEAIGDISIWALLAGFVAALVSGILACQWMIKIVKKGKLIYFAVYCLIIGLTVIIIYS
ncbi:MAG: undecaprenyl-diphosphate phosphatase [Bacteroidota bacterium]